MDLKELSFVSKHAKLWDSFCIYYVFKMHLYYDIQKVDAISKSLKSYLLHHFIIVKD